MRRAARRDDNEAAIVDALKRAGISVEVIGKPVDLLLCVRGETMLMEVKNPERTSSNPESRWTKEQAEFFARWPGKLHFARSPEEAVALAVGSEAMR